MVHVKQKSLKKKKERIVCSTDDARKAVYPHAKE